MVFNPYMLFIHQTRHDVIVLKLPWSSWQSLDFYLERFWSGKNIVCVSVYRGQGAGGGGGGGIQMKVLMWL